MVRSGQGQRITGAPTNRMNNNLVVSRHQHPPPQNQAMGPAPQMVFVPQLPISAYYGNGTQSFKGHNYTVRIILLIVFHLIRIIIFEKND